MNRPRLLILILTTLAGTAGVRAATLERVEVRPAGTVTIGDPVEIVLEILAPKSASITPSLPDDEEDVVWKKPEVARSKNAAPAGLRRWEAVYAVQVFRVGEFAVEPLDIGVGTEVLSTKPLTIRVASVRTGEDADTLKDVRVPVPLPESRRWLLVSLAAAAAALIAGWTVLRWRRRRDAVPSAPERALSPEEWLETQLLVLSRRIVMDEDALREFVAEVSNATREYLARKGVIPATRRTTRETLAALRRLAPEGAVRAAQDLLTAADSVKFAKAIPAEMAAAYIERARALAGTLAEQLRYRES